MKSRPKLKAEAQACLPLTASSFSALGSYPKVYTAFYFTRTLSIVPYLVPALVAIREIF